MNSENGTEDSVRTSINNYEFACSLTCVEPLDSRREALSLNFTKKTAEKSKHSDLFKPIPNPVNTRVKSTRNTAGGTGVFFYTPLPYLTRLLNSNS